MEIFSSIRSRSIKLTSRTSTNQTSSFSRSNTADYGSLYWTFDPNNHYLSPRLTKLVYHKWTIRVWGILWFIAFLVDPEENTSSISTGYSVIRNILFSVPYMISLILSFNRDACGFLVRSSEFWIKICYAVLNGILALILFHEVGRKQRYKDIPEWLGYTYHVCWLVSESLFMAIVGGMDAIPKMKYKVG